VILSSELHILTSDRRETVHFRSRWAKAGVSSHDGSWQWQPVECTVVFCSLYNPVVVSLRAADVDDACRLRVGGYISSVGPWTTTNDRQLFGDCGWSDCNGLNCWWYSFTRIILTRNTAKRRFERRRSHLLIQLTSAGFVYEIIRLVVMSDRHRVLGVRLVSSSARLVKVCDFPNVVHFISRHLLYSYRWLLAGDHPDARKFERSQWRRSYSSVGRLHRGWSTGAQCSGDDRRASP